MSGLSDLQHDPKNPRRHSKRNLNMIADALRDVGAARSIVVDEDGVVLAGNATIDAAAEVGIKRVQYVDADGETIIAVRRSGLTPEQKRRLAYYDNRAGELADWDASQIVADVDAGLDLDGLWTTEEFEALVEDAPGKKDPAEGPGPQIDRAAKLQVQWQTERGQIWEIPSKTVKGKSHRLMCGDSTSQEDVSKLMGELPRVQMAVTSPPYGVGKGYEMKGIGPWFDTVRPVIANLCGVADVVVWNIVDLYSTDSQFIEPTFMGLSPRLTNA